MELNKSKMFSKQWWKEALQLNESPPINFEDDDNYDYVENNLGAINKAALYFNIPVDDLQYAFDAGQNVILNDDVWSKLENTNSYQIESLGQVILHAKQHNIDITPYLKAIKNKQLLPKPLILRYESNRYYLVAGELILSLYKALNQTPEVLQATLNLNINESLEPESKTNLVEDFINYCKDKLQLSQTPKIEFSDDTNHVKEQCSFGYFSPESKAIWVYAGDRNMADIFRTLAHELVHRKQDEDGRIEYESGKTGSDIENEANSMAGVILREFGKSNPEIYDTPIHGFIKSDLNEMKVNSPKINFIFPFIVKDKSQVPYIVDQLNKQGYSLLSNNKIRKFTEEDIFNFPAILDYDSNYSDRPERKILNTYTSMYEMKVHSPGGKISFEQFKKLLVQDMKETAEELEFDNPEEYVQDFKEELDNIPNDNYSLANISKLYEDIGYSNNQLYLVLKRIFIK